MNPGIRSRSLAFGRLAALVSCVLPAGGGCRHGEDLKHAVTTLPGAKVTLLREKLEQDTLGELFTKYDKSYPLATTVPVGVVPTGYKNASAFQFANRNLLIAYSQADESVNAWLLDNKWKNLGSIQNLPVSPQYQYMYSIRGTPSNKIAVEAGLNPKGDKTLEIGLIDYTARKFEPLFHAGNVRSTTAVWAGKKIIAFYTQFNGPGNLENVIVAIDVERPNHQQIHSSQGHMGVHTALLSPDGNKIAFDWIPSSNNKDGGIWLLDLRSGNCRQITFEEQRYYIHVLLRWVDVRQLEFVRCRSRQTLYKIENVPDL